MSTIRHRTINGIVWQGFGRIGFRCVSFVASIILARLLVPGDFGIVGAVLAAMAAVDAFTHVATDQFVVQHDRSRQPDFISTVFWIALTRGLVMAVLLFLASPALARFYNQPKAVTMFSTVALMPLFAGLSNPKAQLLLKDMRFGAWTGYNFVATTLGSACAIALAIAWRNAWALLVGQLITSAGLMVGSYIVAPFLPRFIFDSAAWGEIRRFALQAAGIPALIALIFQAPTLVLGHFRGMNELGVFTLNLNLAGAPVELALGIIGTVALPAYAALKHDPARLRRATMIALSTVMLLGLPLTTTFVWLDEVVPQFVYGAKYAGMPHLFALLVVGGLLQALLAVSGPLFWGIGNPSFDRVAQIVRAVLLYGFALALTRSMGGTGVAIAQIVSLIGAGAVAAWYVRRITRISVADVMAAISPALAATAAIAVALFAIGRFMSLSAYGHLVMAAGIGALVMGVTGLILWHKSTARHPASVAVDLLEASANQA